MVFGRSIPVMPVKGQVVLTEKLPPILRSNLSTAECYILQKDNGELFIGATFEDKEYDTTITEPEIRGLCDERREGDEHTATCQCVECSANKHGGREDQEHHFTPSSAKRRKTVRTKNP